MVIKTKIVKLSDKKAVAKAVQVLRKGSLVIYPTETSYGIAADATNRKAIIKLRHAKKRRSEKLIPIIFSDLAMARKHIFLSKEMICLVKRFMPGPLTLVAEKKMKTKRLLGGFRIPGNVFAQKLVRSFGKPITATSANLSKQPPNYRINDIKKIFSGRVELIIDAGNLPKRKPSTVYDAERKEVIREGRIKEKDIIKAIGS